MAIRLIGTAGRISEKRLSKTLGGTLRPNSGAVEGAKGDIVVGKTLVEAKSTTGRSIKIEHSWLGKISKEARDAGKTPLLALSFTSEDGRPVPNGEWVCMKLTDYQYMKEKAGED